MTPKKMGCSTAKVPRALVQLGSVGKPGMCRPRPNPPYGNTIVVIIWKTGVREEYEIQ
jgi:hypothetical protein